MQGYGTWQGILLSPLPTLRYLAQPSFVKRILPCPNIYTWAAFSGLLYGSISITDTHWCTHQYSGCHVEARQGWTQCSSTQYTTYSTLVQQCQQVLNYISIQHAVGLYWVPGHAGVRGKEIADELPRSGSVQQFVGSEPFLGVSRQNIRTKMKRWMERQHLALWHGPCSTQRQAWELISVPNLATGAWLLLIGHNPGLLLACSPDTTPLRRYLCTKQ